MVQIHPDPPNQLLQVFTQDFLRLGVKKTSKKGAIAQLGERLPCTQEVGGSIPPSSTNFLGNDRDKLSNEKDCLSLALTRRYQVTMFFNNLNL